LIFFALRFRRRACRHGASRDCSETHFPIPPVTRGNSTKSRIAGNIGENPENRARYKMPPTWAEAFTFRGRSSAPTKPKLGRLQLHDVAYGHFGPFATALTAVKIDPAFRAFVTRNEAYDPASAITPRARRNGRARGHADHGC
jgi:hypothetical protein